VDGRAEARDLLAGPPPVRAEVAFALKLLPVLEQREKGAAMALLRAVDAPLIVVSFPTASLGGRGKAMAANYAAWFEPLVTGEGWAASRRDFPGELVYLLQK
jgi:16S rRNA (guanine(1405)-N(7))-methyltransferase